MKKRDNLEDKSSRPNTIKYALSELKMLIAIELRVLTWWALDEITEILNPVEPEKIRSVVYRTFVREGINPHYSRIFYSKAKLPAIIENARNLFSSKSGYNSFTKKFLRFPILLAF